MKQKIQAFSILLLAICIYTNCSKKSDTCNGNIGPIDCEQFSTVSPPTYEQVINCYENAVATNPLLTDSALSIAIFDCIKAAPVQNPPVTPLFELKSRMCVEEWKLVLIYPRKAYLAFKNNITQSLERAKQEFPQDIDVNFKNTKADAFRNAYYGVLVAKVTDTSFARRIALAHQSCLQNPIYLYNDTAGINLVRRFPAATVLQLIDLLLERRYYFIANDIPAGIENALVFSASRRTYDAIYTGTTTNPGGPGSWNATYYFHQTGNIVRGEARYTGIGFSAKDNRRFKGTINGSAINLSMSNPYWFEYTPGYVPCNSMVENFTIVQDSLTGSWTASNCTQGGNTRLKKQ